jgi:hypothetical protein
MKKSHKGDQVKSRLEDFLQRLNGVKQKSAGQYEALCPAHNDKEASLSIKQDEHGKILVHCFAGCSLESILSALGMGKEDLCPKKRRGTLSPHLRVQPNNRTNRKSKEIEISNESGPNSSGNDRVSVEQDTQGITLERYAQEKRLPLSFLKGLGLKDFTYFGKPAIRIPYLNKDGEEISVRFRINLQKGRASDNRFHWKSGAKSFLYGLWQLGSAEAAGYVVIVEGESDCHTLWHHQVPAIGIPGANSWRENRDADFLKNIPLIYIVIEPDAGGDAVKRWLDSSSIRNRVRLVRLGQHKDPSALYLADPDQFLAAWKKALEEAVAWSDLAAIEAEEAKSEAWIKCEELAQEPSILERFIRDLSKAGVVGEDRLAKILYLAFTSRFLNNPVSAAIKGPSSCGKSYVTEQVLEFFPEDAYYFLTAMSERALAYSEEPLSHRFLVLAEAAGLSSDFSTYLIRSLLSEGRIRYETVDKTNEGLKPRVIEREGPTGLIVTTTKIKLHPENETRLLSINVTDTTEQTMKILEALANEFEHPQIDLTPWLALQEWLASSEHQVTIPYAPVLATLIPPVHVTLRRGFGIVLNLIRAHALLHQAKRDLDPRGAIVATIEDYAAVRELVADIVAQGIGASVSVTIREIVETISEIKMLAGAEEVRVIDVARHLKLDNSVASRRIRVTEEKGYIRNLETHKGRPKRLVLGDPLPENLDILPSPDRLLGCMVAGKNEGMPTAPSLLSIGEGLQINPFEGVINWSPSRPSGN